MIKRLRSREIIRATGSGLRDYDYDDLTPYEAQQVAEAQEEAVEQFNDHIKQLMTPEDVDKKRKTLIRAAIITVPIILVAIILGLFLHNTGPKTAVDDLGLDAAHGVYVADKANVLDDKVKQQAYDLNKKLEKSSYHAQIMVVVVNKVPRKYGSINDYSMAIAEKYKPGAKGQNTGLLYTVAIDDHKARLEVGYGLEGKLSDAYTVKLQQPANAHYKKNEYSAGVSALLDGVQQTLLDGKPVDDLAVSSRDVQDNADYVRSSLQRDLQLILFIIGIIALIALIVFTISFVGSAHHERERLDRIKNPEKYEKIDAIRRNMMLASATYNVLHPYSSSSSSSGGGGWSSGDSDFGGGFDSGGDFGGGGSTTDW